MKRDGGKLSTEEIQWTIDAYTRGVMKDEQMAALAMAVFLRGMDRESPRFCVRFTALVGAMMARFYGTDATPLRYRVVTLRVRLRW